MCLQAKGLPSMALYCDLVAFVALKIFATINDGIENIPPPLTASLNCPRDATVPFTGCFPETRRTEAKRPKKNQNDSRNFLMETKQLRCRLRTLHVRPTNACAGAWRHGPHAKCRPTEGHARHVCQTSQDLAPPTRVALPVVSTCSAPNSHVPRPQDDKPMVLCILLRGPPPSRSVILLLLFS